MVGPFEAVIFLRVGEVVTSQVFIRLCILCENHVRRLRTFFTVVLEPNIHTFSVLSETLPDFLKSKLC